jgi:hypothetical protein
MYATEPAGYVIGVEPASTWLRLGAVMRPKKSMQSLLMGAAALIPTRFES